MEHVAQTLILNTSELLLGKLLSLNTPYKLSPEIAIGAAWITLRITIEPSICDMCTCSVVCAATFH